MKGASSEWSGCSDCVSAPSGCKWLWNRSKCELSVERWVLKNNSQFATHPAPISVSFGCVYIFICSLVYIFYWHVAESCQVYIIAPPPTNSFSGAGGLMYKHLFSCCLWSTDWETCFLKCSHSRYNGHWLTHCQLNLWCAEFTTKNHLLPCWTCICVLAGLY